MNRRELLKGMVSLPSRRYAGMLYVQQQAHNVTYGVYNHEPGL